MSTERAPDAPLIEVTVRRRAHGLGFVVKKSRRRSYTNWDRGGYMLLHGETWIIVVGPNFDASLREVADFLDRLTGTNGPH